MSAPATSQTAAPGAPAGEDLRPVRGALLLAAGWWFGGLLVVAATVAAVPGLAAAAQSLVPLALAPRPGSAQAAAYTHVALTNLRLLLCSALLALAARRCGPRGRRALAAALAAAVAANVMQVGAAIGGYGTRLAAYLPHLPLEWLAACCATALCLLALRDRLSRRAALGLLGAGTALVLAAAAVEIWLTPVRAGR